MIVTRRRFLAISAAAGVGALALRAPVTRWRGVAFGADAHIEITGDHDVASVALDAARDTLSRMETLFSVYDPASVLSQFNATGDVAMPPEFTRLTTLCTDLHRGTGGLFDPTVQSVFAAAMQAGGLSRMPRDHLEMPGWQTLRIEGQRLVTTRRGTHITYNGIAQGFAADRVFETLTAHGMTNVLVDAGEFRTGQGTRRIAIENGDGKRIGTHSGEQLAVATSSATGYVFADGTGHIIDPRAGHRSPPLWKTISVRAQDAATADGLSTALMLTRSDYALLRIAGDMRLPGVIAERRDGSILQIGEGGHLL